MTTFDTTIAYPANPMRDFLARLMAAGRRISDRQRTRAALNMLDAHTLVDIGFSADAAQDMVGARHYPIVAFAR